MRGQCGVGDSNSWRSDASSVLCSVLHVYLDQPHIYEVDLYCYPHPTHVELVPELEMPFGTSSSVIFRLLKVWSNPFTKNLVKACVISNTNKSKAAVRRGRVGRRLSSSFGVGHEAAVLENPFIWGMRKLRGMRGKGPVRDEVDV